MTAASDKKKNKPISRASAPKLLRSDSWNAGVPVKIEFDRDSSSITSLLPPAPLPPAPAEGDHEGWFEQIPTNPTQIPDLGALTGSEHESLPGWARSQRLPSVSGEVPRVTRTRSHTNTGRAPHASSPSYALLVLVAAACLAVGMVLGALLQNRLGTTVMCPDPSAHSAAK